MCLHFVLIQTIFEPSHSELSETESDVQKIHKNFVFDCLRPNSYNIPAISSTIFYLYDFIFLFGNDVIFTMLLF